MGPDIAFIITAPIRTLATTLDWKPNMDNSPETQALQTLLRQEQALQFTAFSNDMALELGISLITAARQAGKIITVNITRNAQVLFHHAMTGAPADHADWIRRKNNVVNKFGHSSFYVGSEAKSRGVDFSALPHLAPYDYAAHGGAFPLIIRDVGPVGTITVSGLPQAEDHAMVVDALQTLLKVHGTI
jgi:uncharacterized protein (UPF0303 family)